MPSNTLNTMAADIKRLRLQTTFATEHISNAQREGMHGRLVIVMERGQIRRIIKEESILPPLDAGQS